MMTRSKGGMYRLGDTFGWIDIRIRAARNIHSTKDDNQPYLMLVASIISLSYREGIDILSVDIGLFIL